MDYIDIVYALLLDVYYNKTPSSKVMLNTIPLCERNVIVVYITHLHHCVGPDNTVAKAYYTFTPLCGSR